MKRILICFGYRGTNYAGYQKQPGKITIQGQLEDAIKIVTKENITIYSSGRTDAGVHAIKQYAHFDTQSKISACNFVNAINTYLPEDIRVFDAKEVEENFHARYNVKKKTYMYVFCTSKIPSPIFFDMSTHLKYNLDFNQVNKGIELLKGKHNFKAFCSSKTSAQNFEREIFDITVEKKEDYLIFKVTGNGFLYNMVRIIVGTLVDLGRGKIQLQNVQDMLNLGKRELGGKTISARGLYLFDVEY